MSSGSFYINGCCIYTSCKTQRYVSLSSTESELYALVSVACDGIFLKRVLEFVTGQRVKLQMRTDNQSFKQIAHKSGVSKIRHLDGRYLWIQERVAEGTMAVNSVDGRVNPSDLGIKVPASAARLKALLFMHNVVDSSGDYFVPVGQPEYEQLMTKFENAKQSMHVRRLMNKSLHNGGLTNPSICLLLLNMLSTAAASTVFEPAVVHAGEPLSDVQSVVEVGCEHTAIWIVIVMVCFKLCCDIVLVIFCEP